MADLTITAANVISISGATTSGIAGETLLAGQALYLKAADGRIWKAQADGTVEESTMAGIALNGAGVGQPVVYQTGGNLNIGATTVKTTHYVLSALAGGICPTADLIATQRICYVGYATATDGSFVIHKAVTGAVI